LRRVAPECPDHLIDAAKAEWSRIVRVLVSYRLVADIDTAALALYCQSYGRWQQAESKLKERRDAGLDDLIIESPNGYPIRNPWFDIANRCMEDCHKYLQQFGLSPAARTRVEPNKPVQGKLFSDGEDYFT
jgi:P27 family predicted phage terminase small subunit